MRLSILRLEDLLLCFDFHQLGSDAVNDIALLCDGLGQGLGQGLD